MRVDVFRLKKMSTNVAEMGASDLITTIEMPVLPRVGEELYLYVSESKGGGFTGLPFSHSVKTVTCTVQKVVYMIEDEMPFRSSGSRTEKFSAALFVS